MVAGAGGLPAAGGVVAGGVAGTVVVDAGGALGTVVADPAAGGAVGTAVVEDPAAAFGVGVISDLVTADVTAVEVDSLAYK